MITDVFKKKSFHVFPGYSKLWRNVCLRSSIVVTIVVVTELWKPMCVESLLDVVFANVFFLSPYVKCAH